MQKTKIEWCDITWNPVKGLCPQACWYCYARAMYKRFKWNPNLSISYEELDKPMPKKPSRIFVGSTIDLFHPKVDPAWVRYILEKAELYPQHTFIFLTKNPTGYARFDFPDNCWLGVTVTNQEDTIAGLGPLFDLSDSNRVLFASAEPLLGPIDGTCFTGLDWVIVGALTGSQAKKHQPERIWVADIVSLKRMAKVSIFLKNNLKEVWGKPLIQEHPYVLRTKEVR